MFTKALCFAAVVMMATAGPVSSQQSPPLSGQTKRIEAMVNKAAALVEAKGKAALAEFRTRDSEW